MIGELIRIGKAWVIWSRGNLDAGARAGYVSRNGGITKFPEYAARYEGCGVAIYMARMHGIAIVGW